MTKNRKRRSLEQIVKALQEREAMLAAGKSSAEVYQALPISILDCRAATRALCR
ncbi:hypothetical protein AB1K70_15360 [Bremerella sp. JC770]|uniref:hypothetical protein n=1 Tax=Bremerella sp. JC770 TaxID=3232137 RepID=UPI003459C995